MDIEFEEFQVQNSGPKTLHLEDLPQQVEIVRAKIISKDFGWSKYKMNEKNILREDKT